MYRTSLPLTTFDKNGIAAPAYAVTKHYDIQHPSDDLDTITIMDGFGRPVQVEKDGVVTTASNGSAPKDETVMIVSGRNVYDAFGRVAKSYYPITEALGSKTAFNKTFDNVSPTITVYDVLDRAMKVTLLDNAETKTEYSTDAGSNALTKQTANLKKEGKTINYEYDYGCLTAINYPDHPKNNVKYHYGSINSSYNRIGRLMLREDGSGAI